MSEIFQNIPKIEYGGADSRDPLKFKYYDAERVVLGKKMSEHLPFAMAWWHNLGAAGTDMFGRDTADKSFGAEKGTMEHAKAKVDAGFEFMQKLGIRYFCFHDVDLVPEADDIKGKHLLICDDVLTTGATMEAAIQQLQTIPDVTVSVVTLATAQF